MSGHCKPGISLIEIMIALAIIAVVGTTIVPRLWHTDARQERRNLLVQLNELIGITQQQAIITNTEHKVEFDLPTIRVLRASDKRTSEGAPIFESVKNFVVRPDMTLPKNIDIKQFLINGIDEMSRFIGGNSKKIWFFISADGIAQPVIINMLDKKDRVRSGKAGSFSWVMNPFSAQFKEYDEFQQ